MSSPGRGPLRLSEETQASADPLVVPKNDIILLTGNTTINTIPPPFGGFVYGLVIYLIPTGANITLGAAGNILVGGTATQNKATMLVWSKSQQKWFINAA